jgi:succinate dehydrogenase / fumarate reductase, membrane anchor subunit
MKSFTTVYIWQRVTAIILLFLTPWFLWNLFKIKDLNYLDIVQNFNNPISASLIFLMVISGFYHGYLGIQTICLDYLENAKLRFFVLFCVGNLFSFLSLLTAFNLIALGH